MPRRNELTTSHLELHPVVDDHPDMRRLYDLCWDGARESASVTLCLDAKRRTGPRTRRELHSKLENLEVQNHQTSSVMALLSHSRRHGRDGGLCQSDIWHRRWLLARCRLLRGWI